MRSLDRRAFLRGASLGVGGAAALALVGCGDDDNDKGGGGDLSGLATATPGGATSPTPADPFAGAKRGGAYRITLTGDAPGMDPYVSYNYLTKIVSSNVYSRLFMYKLGPGIEPALARPTGDLVESFETTPDGLKWTMKLRKGVKFHEAAPVNGRELTTDDVKFSWGRATETKNTNAPQLTGVVDSVAYPDASTIVFTLKAPSAAFLDLLADPSLLLVQPVEADGRFNAATTMIGSGPWILDKYTPSVSWKFRKNPNWWMKGFPLLDALEYSIIPEYASRLAQFQAGSTDAESQLAVADLSDLKKSSKNYIIRGQPGINTSYFYFDGNDPNAPWAKDDRVRQAVSMAIDRDALTELLFDVKKLRAAGLEHPTKWNNLIPVGQPAFWLDPQSKDQGESAQFFKYNVAEAKKLLAAAGYPDGFSTTYQYTAIYGPQWNLGAEANIQYLSAIGIKVNTEVQDYASKYSSKTFAGDFKGIAYGPESAFTEAGYYPIRLFTDNALNHGRVKDAQLARLAVDQARELDREKRKAIFWEIQRLHAQHMYYVPHQMGMGMTWIAYQPNMRNVLEFRGVSYAAGSESYPFYWKDV